MLQIPQERSHFDTGDARGPPEPILAEVRRTALRSKRLPRPSWGYGWADSRRRPIWSGTRTESDLLVPGARFAWL